MSCDSEYVHLLIAHGIKIKMNSMLGGGGWEKGVGQGKETYSLRRDLGAKRRALDAVPVRLEVLVVIGMVLGLGHICLQEGGPGERVEKGAADRM